MNNLCAILRTSIIIAFLVSLITTEGTGQEIHRYGQSPDAFYSAFRTIDGNYAICGGKGEWDSRSMWLMILNPDGEVLTDRVYDDLDFPTAGYDIIEVEGGGFLICGNETPERLRHRFFAVRTDEEGDIIWANNYVPEDRESDNNWFNDVIELKNGDFVLAGVGGESFIHEGAQPFARYGWMVRINRDGERIWSRSYRGNQDGEYEEMSCIWSILESGENIIGCGQVAWRGAWLFSVSQENGDIAWERFIDYKPDPLNVRADGGKGRFRRIASHEGDYYAFGNSFHNRHPLPSTRQLMVKFSPNGNVLMQRDINIQKMATADPAPSCAIEAARLVPTGGFVISLNRSGYKTGLVRLDEFGETIWEDTLHYAALNALCISETNDIAAFGNLTSRPPYGAILYKISDHTAPYFLRAGHDNDRDYDRENPVDREQQRNGYSLTVLLGDVVRFWVEAADRQGDDINYEWLLDEEVIGDSTIALVAFDDIGRFSVICRITDDEGATMDSLLWRVNVVELYIRSFQPPMTSLRPTRGEEVNFSLDVRAIEGRELNYRWTLDSVTVAGGDEYLLDALQDLTPHFLTANVSSGNAADSVTWSIQMQSLFRSWEPAGDVISTQVGSMIQFEAILEADLPEGSRPFWFVGDEIVALDTLATEINFAAEGQTRVQLAVLSGEELLEDIRWTVNVTPLRVSDTQIQLPANSILSVQPNPFNSRALIRYTVKRSATVQLSIFDHTGREVSRLVKGLFEAGEHEALFEADSLPAGIYFAILDVAGERHVVKMVLVK